MLLETSDAVDDETSSLSCPIVYCLALSYKIIYIFVDEADVAAQPARGFARFVTMLRTLIHEIISFGEPQDSPGCRAASGEGDAIFNSTSEDSATIQLLVSSFSRLIDGLIKVTNERLLLIINGLNEIGMVNPDLATLVVTFIFHSVDISRRTSGEQPAFKVLLGCKGHATDWTELLHKEPVVSNTLDITDSSPTNRILCRNWPFSYLSQIIECHGGVLLPISLLVLSD